MCSSSIHLDKIRIYSAGYDPLDSEDVADWEKEQDGEAADNIFKFFFHGGPGSKKKRTFDDIFKNFQTRSGNMEEEEEEDEEEFLQASRRRKEEKRRREEQQRMEKEEEEKKEQEERARLVKQKEQEERMRLLKRQEEERLRILKKQEEEKLRILKKKEEERRILEEKRIQERKKVEEQRKKYILEQEQKVKEALLRQEERRRQEAREFMQSSQNQWNRRDGRDFVRSERKQEADVDQDKSDLPKKKKSKKTKGKKKKSKSGGKSKKGKTKNSNKKKKGKAASKQRDEEESWYDQDEYVKRSQRAGKDGDSYTDKDGNTFVRGADGNWYMRVEPPVSKDARSAPPDRKPGDDPAVKILAGGIYRDQFGRIVDNSGNIYMKNPDGTLMIVGKVPLRHPNHDKTPPKEQPLKSVAADPKKSYFHDKNGIPYYIDEQGNYIRVKGPEELKKERESMQGQYMYHKDDWQGGDNEEDDFDDIEVTFSADDLSRSRKKRSNMHNEQSQRQRDPKTDDFRSEIMRKQEEIAKKLLDAQLREGQAYFFHENREDRRRSRMHEEL